MTSPRTMFYSTIRWLLVGALLPLMVVTARGQTGPPDYLPAEGPSADSLSIADALLAAERYELTGQAAHRAIWRAARSGEPDFRPALKAVVEAYRDEIAYSALLALGELGEPDDYLLSLLSQTDSDAFAALVVHALARRPSADLLPTLEAQPYTSSEYRQSVKEYENLLGVSDGLTVRDRLGEHVHWVAAPLASARTPNGALYVLQSDFADPWSVWGLEQLRTLARYAPVETRSAIGDLVPEVVGTDAGPFALEVTELLQGLTFQGWLPPPVGTGVRPILECVDADGRAYLGYEVAGGEDVTIPYGSDNELTPRLLHTIQPETFYVGAGSRLGRSPFYPEAAFSVGGLDSWRLDGHIASVSLSTPTCDRYLPDWQAIEGLPAAVVVEGPVSASFRGSAFAVRGAPHAADGEPVPGDAVAGVVASSPEAAASVRSALGSNQADRVSGSGASPDVADDTLRFSGSAWADALAARATVTLGSRPSGDVGTAESPAVAYAPSGTTLTGGFRGHGVLVVDGPFEMRGNAEWVGLVVVRGSSNQQAAPDVVGSARVVGGLVLVGSDEAPASLSLAGSASVLHSPNALALARQAAFAE